MPTSSTTRTHVPHHRVDLLDALLTAVRFYFDIALYTVVLTALDGWHVLRALVLAPTSAGGDSLNSVNVALHSTPTFFTAFWDHMKYRGSRSQKKRAKQELAYGEGLALVREFLQFAGTFTIEALQSFTGKDTPTPSWIERSVVEVPRHCLEVAAELLREHLKRDDPGFKDVGGKQWWTLRARPLFGEWIEMLRDAQKREAMHRAGQAEQTPERIMLVLHGGAHFFAGNGTHRYQVQRHARKLGARAFSPSFRLAPQYPFPCSLQDALAAYLYLIDPPDSAKIDGADDPPKAIHAHNIVLYGDSSGGALALSLLVVLRDAGLPMPAGCVLMSPWVDLTHSFPSVMGDASGDYISPDGFHYRPSVSWPPIRGDPMVVRKKGKELVVKEQVQLYCSNSMITNPIVSLVNQGSLGGLCPLLVMGGSVELLADEIVYIAHKAADPERYPPAEATLARYPHQRSLISAYPPTKVHLQMYDDCCHVTTTLSFSSPAKFQYRSAANFSLWALAAAQARVEREGQQELVEAQKDQHHFDFATNMEAEHPPQHSSPPRYRRPVVASPPVMSPLPGNEDMFANSPLRNDISAQDSLQPAIPDDASHSPSGHADAGSFMSNGPGTDAGGEKARDGNDSGYLTRVGTSEGRAMDKSASGAAAESTRASDMHEQCQTRARTKSVIDSLRSARSEDSYVTDEDALAANQENEEHSEYTEDSESDEEREQQECAADGSVGVSSRLRSALETAVDAAPSDGLRNAGNANTRARTDTDGSTVSQHVEKQLVNESDLFYPRARFVSVTGVEPAFEDSMIRERVTTDGYIRAMEARSALQALSFPRDEVGVISPEGPILAWLSKRKQWDAKYRRELLHFRKLKMRDRARAAKAGYLSRELRVDEGENPPLSAVAGMYDEELAWEAVRGQDSSSADDDSGQKETAGLGIRLWSSLSSRPDAAQAGKQTLARMARDGDMKLERKVSDGAPIPTPEVEKTILM